MDKIDGAPTSRADQPAPCQRVDRTGGPDLVQLHHLSGDVYPEALSQNASRFGAAERR
ncbi:MAG: hypothetical protein J2P57_07260 [Acidimicrobiaceae bacterium]|nr:hypothetical protein [Acidimicrobiaceae bacterium]